MKTLEKLASVFVLGALLSSCGGKKASTNTESDGDSPRVEAYSFDVTENYLQTYTNSSCYTVATKLEGTDCMLAYNHQLHTIDIFDLVNKKPLKQVKLEKEGPNGINGVTGLFYYKNSFVLQTSYGYNRVGMDGNILSSWSKNDFLTSQEGFTTMVPDLGVYFNMYNFMGFDAEQGLVAFTIYKMEKENGEYPKKIVLLSCNDWSVLETIDIAYPEQMKKEEKLALLGSINALPHGNEVIYNFPASAEIYVYNRTDKTVRSYPITSKFTEPYYRIEDPEDPEECGIINGFYFPLCYDACHKTFWRIQQRPTDVEKRQGVAGKSFSIIQISADFKDSHEYLIPEDQKIHPSLLFTDKMILLPYQGGEKIGENNICFYGLEWTAAPPA